MSLEDEESEQTLAQIGECFVYKIPNLNTMSGHKAQNWDINTFLWTGACTVKSKGDKCLIRLTDPTSGDLFAEAPYDEGTVEPVTDSSRYFVLRLTDPSGRHAFVGIGFTERNEAFEFNAALADHKKYVRERKEAAERASRYANEPKEDFSLGSETISVSIGGQLGSSRRAPREGFTGVLPPPPGGLPASASSPVAAASTAEQPTAHANDNPFANFGDFGAFQGSSQPSQQSKSTNDWEGF